MDIEPTDQSRRMPVRWHRRLAVFACVVALLAALFGHGAPSSAASSGTDAIMIAAGHTDVPARDKAADVPYHCIYRGHCSMNALLAAVSAGDARHSAAVIPAPDQSGGGRVVSPLRRPPRTSDIL